MTQIPQASEDIATIPADRLPPVAPVNPKTGQPRRPATVWVAATCCLLAVVVTVASLLWTYWSAITMFTTASWLMGRFGEDPDLLTEVLATVAVTLAALLTSAASAITGYYAWTGYTWTRIAGVISAVLSLLVLLLNPVGWAAVPLGVAGASLLWLPTSDKFFLAWNARRQPAIQFTPPVEQVIYGPLPRYR